MKHLHGPRLVASARGQELAELGLRLSLSFGVTRTRQGLGAALGGDQRREIGELAALDGQHLIARLAGL